MAGDGQPERAQNEALVDVLGDLLLSRPEVAAEGSTHPRLTIGNWNTTHAVGGRDVQM